MLSYCWTVLTPIALPQLASTCQTIYNNAIVYTYKAIQRGCGMLRIYGFNTLAYVKTLSLSVFLNKIWRLGGSWLGTLARKGTLMAVALPLASRCVKYSMDLFCWDYQQFLSTTSIFHNHMQIVVKMKNSNSYVQNCLLYARYAMHIIYACCSLYNIYA